MTSKPRLTYFDAPVSRGEECRLALHLAGVEFDDNRVKGSEWPSVKATTPYGAVPVLELPGKPPLAQSNAILGLIGRRHGLHPSDDFEAAHHEAMMGHCEDLRIAVARTISLGPEEKKAEREKLAATTIPTWAAATERAIGDGPFFAGAKLHVVDLKLHMIVRWFIGGKVDHIPATVFDGHPKLLRVYEAVRDHDGVKAWYKKTT